MDKIEKISGLYSVETCNCYGNPPFALTVCGDCIDGMRSLPDKSVDCIISDLPYGCTKNKWDVQLPLDKLWNQYIEADYCAKQYFFLKNSHYKIKYNYKYLIYIILYLLL